MTDSISTPAAATNGVATVTGQLALDVRGVTTGYGSRTVLEDVSLTVEPGEFLAIVGPNGGGKTTLLRAILGLLPTWRGEIRIFGDTPRRGRRHIGYVPQGIEFDPSFPMRVQDVVRMGRLGNRGLFQWLRSTDREAAAWALQRVGLSELHRRPIGELSGGQRQRVYIARALASKPKMLLLDEPTAQVDPDSRSVVYELLRELNREITVVMVSHDLEAVASWCSKVACVDRRLYLATEGLERDPNCGRVHLPPHSHGHDPDPSCDPTAASSASTLGR